MKKMILRLMFFLIIGAVPVINSASTLPQINSPDLSNLPVYKVVRVVDGDTLVAANGSEEIKIRLIGVDTPETVHPRKPVEEYGKEASNFLKNLLKGESIHLKITSKDKYDRTLAYVFRYPDGLFVNAEIIRQGYGHAYTNFPFEYMEQFRELEKFARVNQKGLWGSGGSIGTDPNEVGSNDPNSLQSQQANKETVYITRTGSKYHRAECSSLSKSKRSISKADAIRRGLSPCSVCNP